MEPDLADGGAYNRAMSRVVVAEEISPAGLEILRKGGHEVVEIADAPREKLLEELATADALLVRSRTKVDAKLLAAAPRLSVVGRAGVGVDNVDVAAASARGVLVINAPTGNVVSAVEHTFALLLALLRRVVRPRCPSPPEVEKSKFVGSELAGKTLGIVGLGQVGSRVAAGRGPSTPGSSATTPTCLSRRRARWGVPLVSLDELLATSDILTLHATATEGSRPLLGREELAKMKPGAVLVNVARGSLVDRIALHEALTSGRLAGAALDVFDPEPPDPADPLLSLPNVVATPHLGASTVEAQERVSLQTAEAVAEALAGASYVPAVNLPFRGPKDAGGAAAWMGLAERMGRFLSCVAAERLRSISVETWGCPRTFSVRSPGCGQGRAPDALPETVNFVNALFVAGERGLAVAETRHEGPGNYARIDPGHALDGRSEARAVGTVFSVGTRAWSSGRPAARIPAGGNSRLPANRDVPGVVGRWGRSWATAGSTSRTSRCPRRRAAPPRSSRSTRSAVRRARHAPESAGRRGMRVVTW